MSAVLHRLTEPEYLDIERRADHRSEFYAGRMYAMAGAGERHNHVAGNAYAAIHGQIRGRACRVYQNDMRVRVDETGLYTYPDIVVVCGERRFADGREDTLLNPTLIIEVLSESTESYDRGEKFEHYRRLDSLREYVLVGQDRPSVESYLRQGDGSWRYSAATSLGQAVSFPSIGCVLALADIYEDVQFPTNARRDHLRPSGPGVPADEA